MGIITLNITKTLKTSDDVSSTSTTPPTLVDTSARRGSSPSSVLAEALAAGGNTTLAAASATTATAATIATATTTVLTTTSAAERPAAAPALVNLSLDDRSFAIVQVLHFFIVLSTLVAELELAAETPLGDVLALERGDVSVDAGAVVLGAVDLHRLVVLAEDQLAVKIGAGLGLGGLAHLDGLGGRDVGQGVAVEQIKRLILVFDDIRVTALPVGALALGACGRALVVGLVVGAFRVAAVESLVQLVVELASLAAILFVTLLASLLGGVLLLLTALLGLADVDDELPVAFRTVLVDEVETELAYHALQDMPDLALEVALVLVAPDDEVGNKRRQARDHEFRGKTDDADLDETQDTLDDLAVVGGQEEIHGLDKVGKSLCAQGPSELVKHTAEGGDGRRDHVGGATNKTSADHGEELLQVGLAGGRVRRHVRDLGVVNGSAVRSLHAVTNLNKKIVSSLSGALVVLLAANDDLAKDGRDEVERGVGDIREEGRQGAQTLSTSRSRHLLSTRQEHLLQLVAACFECQFAGFGLGKTRDQLLRLILFEDDDSSDLEQGRVALAGQNSKHIASEAAQVLQVLLRSSSGDTALEHQVLLAVILNGSNGLIGLDEDLERSANLKTQLDLLVQNVCEKLSEGLVKRLCYIKREIAVARQGCPNLLHKSLKDLDFHSLLRLAVVQHPLEHEFTEGHHLLAEMSKVGVAKVVAEDGEHPRATLLTLGGLSDVQRQYGENSLGTHGADGLSNDFVSLLLALERVTTTELSDGLGDVEHHRACWYLTLSKDSAILAILSSVFSS
ncbi:uncharacterized protein ColSpa_07343 [Colletotrichum spaethianum]|uniref:Uncharacterized protein n=1 Tax=Colletotrichum spaethianum TaxID=700344 RepID=A0AA37LEP6_9PEZI|nr:uncharacterized protein ColSpa_07343 [Colletotrichum spaethianum]GKT47162.1 hypothetical protein ColSpa_07343 [Colletotrichum spaethianum]